MGVIWREKGQCGGEWEKRQGCGGRGRGIGGGMVLKKNNLFKVRFVLLSSIN